MCSFCAGLLYSPEDTLNNDFFYDDEFSVPFDANLTEAEMKMLDSMDLNAILHLSKNCGDDNVKWHDPKMTSSKSDTCLYQAEIEFSDSEREMDTSGERDIVSSSELSDFKSEPLFSPPPEFDESVASTADSIGREELSGSYSLREEPRYNYDWTANKDQYILSFDRSPSKQSDSSTGRTPTPSDGHGSITSWAQRSVTTSQTSWGSMARQGLTTSGNGGNGCHPGLYRSSQKSSTGSSVSTMMTWRQVKEQSSPEHSPESGMTTWKTLCEECHCNDEITGTRSKSLPDLKSNQTEHSDGARSVVTDCGDEQRRQHSAHTLLELFQRSRSREENGFSPSVSMEAGFEAMISPTSLNQLAGTWSVSPVHSDGSYATAPQTVSDRSFSTPPLSTSPNVTPQSGGGMVSWNTFKNTAKINTSAHQCSAPKPNAVDTSVQVSICSGSLGSKPKGLDLSIQCAPSLTDCGIQTSFVDSFKKQQHMTNRSLQTSVSMGEIMPIPAVRLVHRSQSQPANSVQSQEQSPELVVQLSARAKERMSRSAYFVSRGLPDLSFLNKAMSQSVASTPSPKESLHSSGGSSCKGSVDNMDEKGKFKDFKQLYCIGRQRDGGEGDKVPTVNSRPFTREQLDLLKRHQQALHQMERIKILEEHSRLTLSACEAQRQSRLMKPGQVKQASDKTNVPSESPQRDQGSVTKSQTLQTSITRQLLKQTGSRLSQIPRKPSRIPGKSGQTKGPPTMKKPQLPIKHQVALVSRMASPQNNPKVSQRNGTVLRSGHGHRPAVPAKPVIAAKPRLLTKPSQIPTPTKGGCSPSQSQERLRMHEKSIARIRKGESSDSRESSPGLSSSRRSRSTDSASTTNSFCSSSSSGIDPGLYEHHHHGYRGSHTTPEPSRMYDGHSVRPLSVTSDPRLYSFAPDDAGSDTSSSDGSRRIREKEYWADTEDSTGTGRMSRKDSGLGFSGHKSPTLCSKCKEKVGNGEDDSKPMTKSHPTYSKLVPAVDKDILHTVEYLLVSPTRKPKQQLCEHKKRSKSFDQGMIAGMSSASKRQPPPKPPRCRAQLSLDETYVRDSASENSDSPKKPLKSCLVKRRKGERKGNALKHRSWSDPYDGMVLKYSHNGEIKYQLVTHDAKCEWRHSTGDLPVQVVPQEEEPEDVTPTQAKVSFVNYINCLCHNVFT